MKDGRIPKDLLFGELATGTRPLGRPSLRFKDICKQDLKDCGIKKLTFKQPAQTAQTGEPSPDWGVGRMKKES